MFSNPHKNLSQVHLSEGMIVADFGAGSGYYALEASHFVGNSGKVFCIDLSHDLLRKLANEAEKEGLKNIEVIWGDLEKEGGSSLKEESVDLVLIANALFQIENKENFINEAKRVLKKKGRALFVEWGDNGAGIGPHRNHLIKKDDAIELFKKSGFSMEKEIDAGDHHYGIIFRRI